MPSTYTANNRFELQNPGENLNTWGTKLNNDTTSMIDQAIAGYLGIGLSGSITLTTANGASDQARNAIVDVTSGSGGTITIPSVSKLYVVRVASGVTGNVTLTTGGNVTAVFTPGDVGQAECDGTNVRRGVTTADVTACLAAANAYASGLAFDSSSGQLPGQAGNAGNFLQTNGSNALWAPISISGTLLAANNLSDVASAATALANLGGVASASPSLTNAALSNPTITGGSVVPAVTPSAASPGYLGLPQNVQTGNYTAVMGDIGKEVFFTGNATGTIPANASVAFPIGTVMAFSADVGKVATITITSDSMVWVPTGVTTNRTVTGPGTLIAVKKKATTWWVYNDGGVT